MSTGKWERLLRVNPVPGIAQQRAWGGLAVASVAARLTILFLLKRMRS